MRLFCCIGPPSSGMILAIYYTQYGLCQIRSLNGGTYATKKQLNFAFTPSRESRNLKLSLFIIHLCGTETEKKQLIQEILFLFCRENEICHRKRRRKLHFKKWQVKRNKKNWSHYKYFFWYTITVVLTLF